MGNAGLAEEIVHAVLVKLRGRGGFDEWWCDIDEEIQQEIADTLIDMVTDKLDREEKWR